MQGARGKLPGLWCERRDVEHPRQLCRLGASCIFARKSRNSSAQLATVSSPESSDLRCWKRSYEPRFAPEFAKAVCPVPQNNPFRREGGALRDFTQRQKGHRLEPVPFLWCEKRDLNPYGVNHTPLKRARLPVPPLSHSYRKPTFSDRSGRDISYYTRKNSFVKAFPEKNLTRREVFHTPFSKAALDSASIKEYNNILYIYRGTV